MTRWMMGAVLVAGSLLVYPLQAAAQDYERGTKDSSLLCGYFPDFSFAVIESRSANKRATCMWKCIYKMPSGAMHVNSRNADHGTRTPPGNERDQESRSGHHGESQRRRELQLELIHQL